MFVGIPQVAFVEMFHGDVADPQDVIKFSLYNHVDDGPARQRNVVEAFAFEDCDRCVVTLEQEVTFLDGEWKTELASLSNISDPVEVIKIAATNGLGSVVAGMNHKKVTSLTEVIERT
ncbi:hypothetical protein PanWU01x14_109610 [Parasponia andersonii]|uniref:Uncharacterized protein n=1 Tax=Parasponia andersonii TaxID=3476 RepID=A0A2P5CZR1_PARAD|nr:hypothetical protein PanWU01x14_109610 [Parasponia andersonii]